MTMLSRLSRRAALIGLALVLLVGTVRAQSGPAYGARLSTGVAKLGEEITLVISIVNANGNVESIPSVPGLEFGRLGSPSVEERISIQGARRVATRTLTWRVRVRPLELGEYDIPGIELVVENERVTTAPMHLTVVEDMLGEELGFLDVELSSTTLVEKMPFELVLTFGWDLGIGDKINYANLILPWWGKMNELLELESPPGLLSREQRVALNSTDEVVVEELPVTKRDGRSFRTFRLKRAFLPTRAAELDLSQPFLEFGDGGRRSLFGTSRKKETYFVRGEPIRLSIGELPQDGQPLDWTGAVGVLDVRAEADTRDVDVGESIKVTVTWTGSGNLQFFDPPQLGRDEAFADFRVFGSANREKDLNRRTVEFDLAPLTDSVTEIPPIVLPVYDPEEEAFVRVATEPIPIRVRALENPALLEDGNEGSGLGADIEDIDTAPIARSSGGPTAPGLVTLGLLFGGVLVGWLAFRTGYRRRRGDPDAPVERRRRRARKVLAAELKAARTPAEELHALQRFLAARTREPEVAWIGRDPSELEAVRLGEVGDELASAIARLERRAYAASSNGEAAPESRELLDLADRLIRGGL